MNLAADGDPTLGQNHASGVKMALELCETVPGQFKLVETPLNSFLLVTNVVPEDTRPWKSHLCDDLDFSNIALPKLHKLSEVLTYAAGGEAQPHSPPPAPPRCSPFVVYNTPEWQAALSVNKDALVVEAMEALSAPENWQGVVPEDPLACMWLLFYGKNSFCANPDCLFLKTFHHTCPILLPPHLYRPKDDPGAFLRHLCQYVKFLYQNQQNPLGDLPCHLGEARIQRAMQNLELIAETEAYLSQSCLICHLYKQNSVGAKGLGDSCGCIILGGLGERYITNPVSARRVTGTGDTVLMPSYNLPCLLRDLRLNGAAGQG